MKNARILVVDDEERVRKLVKDYLVMSGYTVLEASNGQEAVEIFLEDRNIDLIILDVMMPVMDGYETLKTIRQYSRVPVILLTARTDESDELKGFGLEADEYIGKPFSPKILVARAEALLRRFGEASGEKIEAGGIIMDKSAHTVTVDGESIDLSVKEYDLLQFFIENQGRALNRESILTSVWNYDYFGDARTIDTHVKKLRAKLGEKGDYIKTIWGMGYKFELPEGS